MIEWLETALILGYGGVILLAGLYLARGQVTPSAFYLAERTLGTVGVSGSLFSTFFGTGLLFTFATFGYQYGVGAFALPGAAAAGLLLLGVAAPRINRMSDRQGAVTLPALLDRYWSGRTQAVAALVTIGLFTGTLAANLVVVGEILRAVTDIPGSHGIAGFAAVVIGYTVLGGFRGVVLTDLVQLVLIVLAFAIVLPTAIVTSGTVGFASIPPGHLDPWSFPLPVIVAYLLIGVFAFFGSQDVLQRIFSARNPATARRGVFVFTGLLAVVGSAAVGLGMVARGVAADQASDVALYALTEAIVPPALIGLVVIGFLSLANSDVDSQVLTVASNVTRDLLPALRVDPEPAETVKISRFTVAGIGLSALAVALVAPSIASLFGAVGSWFAVLGFVVLGTLYWDRSTDTGAFIGLLAGFLAPLVFVALTGEFQVATFVGLVPAIVLFVTISLLIGARVPNNSSEEGEVKNVQ